MSDSKEKEVSEISKGAAMGKTILAYLSSPVAVLSKEMKVAYANPAFESAFQVELKNILGNDIIEVISPNIPRQTEREFSEAIEKGQSKSVEFAHGERKFVSTLSMIRDGFDGPVMGAVVTLDDVTTERKLGAARAKFVSMILEDLKGDAP